MFQEPLYSEVPKLLGVLTHHINFSHMQIGVK